MSHTVTLTFPSLAPTANLPRTNTVRRPTLPTQAATAAPGRVEQKFGAVLAEMISNAASFTFAAAILTWLTVFAVSVM